MCSPMTAALAKAAPSRILVGQQRRVRTKANPLATRTQDWFANVRNAWWLDITSALQHGGFSRLDDVLRGRRPPRQDRRDDLAKALSAAKTRELEAELQELFRNFGLRQMNSAGRRAARSARGKWVMRPELAAKWSDKLANKIVLLSDSIDKQIRDSVKRIVTDSLRESPRPSPAQVARRIARSWYGPPMKGPRPRDGIKGPWPGRGTAEEQRITADWARKYSGGLQPGEKEYLFSFERAHTIARTELAQAENAAIADAYSQTNVKLVGWLAFPYNPDHDGPGKRNHYLMNKHPPITIEAMQGSDKSQWFKLPSGIFTPYPNWIELPAGETVNCQCTTVPRRG